MRVQELQWPSRDRPVLSWAPGCARASARLLQRQTNVTESLDRGRKRSDDLHIKRDVKTYPIDARVLQKARVNATSSRANVEAARTKTLRGIIQRERKVENKLTRMLGLNVRLECTATRGISREIEVFLRWWDCVQCFFLQPFVSVGSRLTDWGAALGTRWGNEASDWSVSHEVPPSSQSTASDVSRPHTWWAGPVRPLKTESSCVMCCFCDWWVRWRGARMFHRKLVFFYLKKKIYTSISE